MNKKTTALSLLLLAGLSGRVMAQSAKPGFEVRGVVVDSLSHEGEAYATARLLSAGGSKPVKVAVTSEKGAFSIAAPKAGNYILELIALGKSPVRRSISLTAENTVAELDTLQMQEYNSTLGTATVTAQRQLVRAEIDKMTYSVADDPDAQTNSVLEILRKVPMVTVDGEDNIKVNGNSGFKVYVDGKPNAMMSANPSMIFKAYPASAIKKIEVITNPGAKYDAEGVSGVLNIVTNTGTKTSGYLITPSLTVTSRGVRGNVFAMTQVGKLTISAHYGIGSHRQPDGNYEAEREVFADDVNHLMKSDGTTDTKGVFQFGSLDASYEISDKDLISVNAGLNSWAGETDIVQNQQMLTAAGATHYSYKVNNHTDMTFRGYNASADYQHTFKEDTRITFSYRYSHNPSKTAVDTRNEELFSIPSTLGLRDQSTDPDNLSREHTAQVDYTTLISKIHTLSVGAKYINRMNRSNNTELWREAGTDAPFELDETRSLLYRHRGDIAAAYAEYTLKKNKWAFVAGNRYEYYRVRVTYPDGRRDNFSTHMDDWVPSVSLGYSLKPTMLLRAGYDVRIGRPSIEELSPYVKHDTPETASYGNPDLGSERSHNLNLTYSTFGAKLTFNTSLTYSFSNNGSTSYSFMKDNIYNTTYGNYLHSKLTNLSIFMNWAITSKTSVNFNCSGSYADYKSPVIGDRNSGFSANGFGSLQQDLPWKLKLSVFGGGGSGDINLQGRNTSYYFYNLTLRRSFLAEDRLTISLSAGNFIHRYQEQTGKTRTADFRSFSRQRNDFSSFAIAIRYKLGSLKAMVKKASRSIENDDVKSSSNPGTQGTGGMQQ